MEKIIILLSLSTLPVVNLFAAEVKILAVMDDSGDVLDVFLEDFIKETRPFYLAIIVLVIVLIFIQNMVMYLPNPVY
ncbi:hypothetical protein [Oceanispirochaeta sp.]|uniref:hypothetical protein n=1 Tax=Oceanispirochaeta sp. TaxID=2035350 RepID=UPI00260BEA87|nr:hypothetical protein [Oceanispirochaeta sp.]MDA3955095.1 hypothetical protein [Oceanispirochaeta sp.]